MVHFTDYWFEDQNLIDCQIQFDACRITPTLHRTSIADPPLDGGTTAHIVVDFKPDPVLGHLNACLLIDPDSNLLKDMGKKVLLQLAESVTVKSRSSEKR